jgi:hypothetical protein
VGDVLAGDLGGDGGGGAEVGAGVGQLLARGVHEAQVLVLGLEGLLLALLDLLVVELAGGMVAGVGGLVDGRGGGELVADPLLDVLEALVEEDAQGGGLGIEEGAQGPLVELVLLVVAHHPALVELPAVEPSVHQLGGRGGFGRRLELGLGDGVPGLVHQALDAAGSLEVGLGPAAQVHVADVGGFLAHDVPEEVPGPAVEFVAADGGVGQGVVQLVGLVDEGGGLGGGRGGGGLRHRGGVLHPELGVGRQGQESRENGDGRHPYDCRGIGPGGDEPWGPGRS